MVWIEILLILILVQTVRKSYQQTRVAASKESYKLHSTSRYNWFMVYLFAEIKSSNRTVPVSARQRLANLGELLEAFRI